MRRAIKNAGLGIVLGLLSASLSVGSKPTLKANAYDAPAYSNKLPTAITLKDTAESDIRS